MAEYIDRDILHEQVIKFFNVYGLNDFIDTVPTADVIERYKVNKAIREIKGFIGKLYFEEIDYRTGLESALRILKRNIGE